MIGSISKSFDMSNVTEIVWDHFFEIWFQKKYVFELNIQKWVLLPTLIFETEFRKLPLLEESKDCNGKIMS